MPEKSNRNFNHTNQKRESIKQDGYVFIYIKKFSKPSLHDFYKTNQNGSTISQGSEIKR